MRRLVAIDLGGRAGRGISIDRERASTSYPARPGLGPSQEALRADFRRGLPLKDSCVDVVYAYHTLEYAEDLVSFMEELWRVCKPSALVYAWVPHATSPYVRYVDPAQRRAFLIESFAFFSRYQRALFDIEVARLYFTTRRFWSQPRPLRRLVAAVLEGLANRSRGAQYWCERWWGHWLGFEEALVVLRAVKGEEWGRRVAPRPSPRR